MTELRSKMIKSMELRNLSKNTQRSYLKAVSGLARLIKSHRITFPRIWKSDKRYDHLKDMVKIALNTGMRQGEILAMEKDWINLKEGLIIVPRHSQKRKKKEKRVPINSEIRPIVVRLLRKNKGSEYLFVNPKAEGRYTTIQNSWNSILEKAGLKGKPGVDKLRFHDLRHTAATNLARKGKDIKFIAQYLGHSDVRTSAR